MSQSGMRVMLYHGTGHTLTFNLVRWKGGEHMVHLLSQLFLVRQLRLGSQI